IKNKADFTQLDWLRGVWELQLDGEKIGGGELSTLEAGPGESQTVKLHLPQTLPAGEAFLMLRFSANTDTPWCGAGHEVAWEQLALQNEPVEISPLKSVGQISEANGALTLASEQTQAVFQDGALTSLRFGEQELLEAPLQLQIFRAP
ncbi:beta-galactosidase domain 4-containing protein, partial [Escherichia coli]|uniref:DUF4981 domain-containing protein n=1 Tax=Escherichia coli TaxID=562 RepID=UPI003FA54590